MKQHFFNTIEMRLNYIEPDRRYYNLLISRFWIPFRDKAQAKKLQNS